MTRHDDPPHEPQETRETFVDLGRTAAPEPAALAGAGVRAARGLDSQAEAAGGVESRAPGARPITAVIVAHGMGQQVKFETLELVANALRQREAARQGRPGGPRVAVEQVMLGESRLARAALEVGGSTTRSEIGARDVHLFEAYWAPITEDKVSLRDVMRFLLFSGVDTLRHTDQRHFDRWMFGRWVRFVIHRGRTAFELFAVLAVLLAMLGVQSVLTAVIASRTLTGGAAPWPSPALFRLLTLDVVGLLLAGGLIGLGTLVAPKWRTPVERWFGALRRRVSPHGSGKLSPLRLGSVLGWTLVVLGLLAVLVAPVVMGFQVIKDSTTAHDPSDQLKLMAMVASWSVWAVLLVVSFGVRWFLIEFVGDVPAYISAHTASKFWELRQKIQEIGLEVARAVYSARGPGGIEPLYDRVIVIAHSLGSLVAYDMLNGLMLEDQLRGLGLQVPQRTGMLLTFGSPLEKTAYLFRTQRPHLADVREALAASVQPMIQDYEFRPHTWVNLYSRHDVISAPLGFYDAEQPPDGGVRRVENIEDLDADQPLLAHTQYWRNPLMADVLHQAVTGTWRPGVLGEQGSRADRRGGR